MNTLIVVLISGMAAGYVVELIVAISERWLSAKITRVILTAPLSVYTVYVQGLTGATLVVAGFAAAFFALAVLRFTTKPEITQMPLTRRL
jgi:ABC-type transport system involved in multi-copper enzyme maturation permease subunit